MICPNCEYHVKDGVNFCPQCRYQLYDTDFIVEPESESSEMFDRSAEISYRKTPEAVENDNNAPASEEIEFKPILLTTQKTLQRTNAILVFLTVYIYIVMISLMFTGYFILMDGGIKRGGYVFAGSIAIALIVFVLLKLLTRIR